ncbi:MAG: aldehyde dehydrogenase family protein [Bryobacteraceae bacterium]|jgi:acyl-CoA reductase-like NAD-dependent aldehyde dehydrogenase
MTSVKLEQTSLNYIGGEWVDAAAHEVVKLPYDGTPVGEVPQADAGAVDKAVAAARKALPQMREMGNCDRADLLSRIGELMKRDVAEYAQLICAETGKPAKEARVEAERCLATVAAAAHEARQLHGEVVPMDFVAMGKGRMAVTVREPLGVIGCITPFNVPLNLALHKVAPALAAGNTVVHKPATKTPLSAARLAHTMEEAGVPKGAYNLITGSGARLGMAMAEHPGIAMLTFTGSPEVGRTIKSRAGFKKVTLELGNNSAVIVEPEADLATAVARTTQGAFSHSGQVCISVQRVFVHRSIAGEFVERLKASTEALKIGHPYEESTDISSLIDEQEAIRIEQWLAEAKAGGAKVITGGTRKFATVAPAVLVDVPATCHISCQEAFGPVVAVYPYDNLDDAIERANATPYGLQAGIFTNDIQRAFRAARRLEVGGVMINDIPMYRADHMPYGGVKESGTGREGPRYAIEEMTEMKLICWKV